MNANNALSVETKLYMFQPGDSTRYNMQITQLDNAGSIITGIGHGYDYILLTILMSGGSGSVIVGREDLNYLDRSTLAYMQDHGMGDVYDYTLAACALAARVLINEPDNLSEAAEAMLHASDLLNGKIQFDGWRY